MPAFNSAFASALQYLVQARYQLLACLDIIRAMPDISRANALEVPMLASHFVSAAICRPGMYSAKLE